MIVIETISMHLLFIIIYLHIIMFSIIPIEYKSYLNRSIWATDGTLTDTTLPGQSRPGSNGNKEVSNIFYSSTTVASPLNAV